MLSTAVERLVIKSQHFLLLLVLLCPLVPAAPALLLARVAMLLRLAAATLA
jgi:hypothetical protein